MHLGCCGCCAQPHKNLPRALPGPHCASACVYLSCTEGLHLIDFEQLKIENQSLNEKIEERNEELVKLRKKTTVTVQVGGVKPGQ